MSNFAHAHVGTWRDGQGPSYTKACYVVSYDQTNTAYVIERGELDVFTCWVAAEWAIGDNFQGEDEESSDYLERVGITITQHSLI